MKTSTKHQIKGKLLEMKGAAKAKVGLVASNGKLVAEGQDEELAGKVEKKIGQIARVFEK
jgi:uncharacterized protein YjbJ (UPF0337 family)